MVLAPWPTGDQERAEAIAVLRTSIGEVPADEVVERVGEVAAELVQEFASEAVQVLKNEAVIRCASWLYDKEPAFTKTKIGDIERNYTYGKSAMYSSGAAALLSQSKRRWAGICE